jgi:C_GCAxxG_C_C family probable redox protein
MNKSEFAAAGMTNQYTNCAQSVINAFVDELGIERETALKLSLGFGGGMGHTGGACGAVTAACLVLGLKAPFDSQNPKAHRDNVYSQIQEFTRRFKAANGSTNCTQLLGHDLSTPQGAAAVKAQNLSATLCPQFVSSAVKILEEMSSEGNAK